MLNNNIELNELKHKLREINYWILHFKHRPKCEEFKSQISMFEHDKKLIKREINKRKKEIYDKIFEQEIKVRKYHQKNREKFIKESCEECGNKVKLCLHHEIYSKEIPPMTLCNSCHSKLHFATWLFRPTILKNEISEKNISSSQNSA